MLLFASSLVSKAEEIQLVGSGTEFQPYLISNASELKKFSELLATSHAIHGRLTADIVLNENVLDDNYNLNGDGSQFEQWQTHGFDGGSFNGAGHCISGLYINNGKEYQALFGNIGICKIDSLALVDCYVSGYRHIGGIASWVGGGSTISNCSFDGVIIASSDKAGGISAHLGNTFGGVSQNKIINCFSKGKIQGSNHVGGICGSAYSLTNTNDDYIAHCYSIAKTNASWTDCGEICGYVNAVGSWLSGSAYNCYSLAIMTSTQSGQGYSGEVRSLVDFKTGTVLGLLNVNGGIFHQNIGVDDYPTLFGIDVCSTPSIQYSDGKLNFYCSTSGAKFKYSITSPDFTTESESIDGCVNLDACYVISVYAIADGYTPSETVIATLYWGEKSLELDNISDIITRGVMVQSHNGTIIVSGLDYNEKVSIYNVSGMLLGHTTSSYDGEACYTIDSKDEIVIVKCNNMSIKVILNK